MANLNDIGEEILKAKGKTFENGGEFSLAFLGDSHIGQITVNYPKKGICECGIYCPERRFCSLLTTIRDMKGIYAIFLGGDCVDDVRKLDKFVRDTEEILQYNNTTIQDQNKTPLFANIGNHEYHLGKRCNMNEFKKKVGKTNDIVKLFGPVKGPRVAVVFINTGYGKQGKMPRGLDFEKELNKLSKQMQGIENARFIIDMHIPPRIPNQLTSEHVLNSHFNNTFENFIKENHTRILAIVAHHLHDKIQTAPYTHEFTVNGKKYTIPLYLTAQGGHCDYVKSAKEPYRYSFYRFNFSKKTNSNYIYEIISVYRYDMVRKNGKFVLERSIKI